ncbi:MAG: tetratricopeptide repeat protein, partial [Bryobacterales bacterium]|nr:tetratricopeptide repeat protein [Bryobacterales bacterium]
LEPNNGAYLDSLGWVYYRQNKLDLAAKFLERSLEQYKDDPVVHTHLGDVYYKQGRIAEAKRHWNRGLEEWNRSAPADRDATEVESLRRKLAEVEVSMAGERRGGKDESRVKR